MQTVDCPLCGDVITLNIAKRTYKSGGQENMMFSDADSMWYYDCLACGNWGEAIDPSEPLVMGNAVMTNMGWRSVRIV